MITSFEELNKSMPTIKKVINRVTNGLVVDVDFFVNFLEYPKSINFLLFLHSEEQDKSEVEDKYENLIRQSLTSLGLYGEIIQGFIIKFIYI